MNPAIKVGDLVKWIVRGVPAQRAIYLKRLNTPDWEDQPLTMAGVVLQLSRTGRKSFSVKVLTESGKMLWVPTMNMEVISEGPEEIK